MLVKILAVLGIAVVALVMVIASKPDTFSYSRSLAISATPEKVFPLVNNLHEWETWSPWAKVDPNIKHIYEGAGAGVGAVCKWSGNHEVGEGSNTITESRPSEFIRMRLEFIKPFKGTNDVVFTFRPEGDQTVVTWGMSGKNNFLAKAVGLVMNCQKMCEGQFDKGLSQLKARVEGA